MKLQINTTEKSILIEESVNLNDLFETLDKLFPNSEWKEYKLEQTIINNWTSPIIIKEYEPYPYYPTYPWNAPIYYGNQPSNPFYVGDPITLNNGTGTGLSNISTLTTGDIKVDGIYNVQV